MCFHVRYYALLVMPLAPFYVISIVILRCVTQFSRYLPKLIMGAFLGMFFVRFKVSWVAHFRGGEATLGAPSEFFSCMDSLQRKAILSRGDMKGKLSFLKAVFGRVLRQKIAYLGGNMKALKE